MSRIAFERDDNQLQAAYTEACHREAFVRQLLDAQAAILPPDGDPFSAYDDWYLGVLQDGLLRRAVLVEYREWCRHVEDLVRDQLARNDFDNDLWETASDGPGGGSLVRRLRAVLEDHLEVQMPTAIWTGLEELEAVAETVNESNAESRARLQARYPQYFSQIDAFGDGDEVGRLTLRPRHLNRLLAVVKSFWDPQSGLPHRRIDGAA